MTITDFLHCLFEIKSIDVINAVVLPASIGVLLSFALSRYLAFTQTMNNACAEVHRLNLLQYNIDDIEAQKMLIRDITYRITGLGVALRTEGHRQASDEIRKIATHYRDLLVDAADKFQNTPPETSILWTREIFTNYAARLLALTPNYGALFNFARFYSDVAITNDCPIDQFKGPEPLEVRTTEV